MKRGTLPSGGVQARARAHDNAVSVRGASGDPTRGSYCTPKYVANALPSFDLDPFTNSRSHIRSALSCQLERGDDGFGTGAPGTFATSSVRDRSALEMFALLQGAIGGRMLLRATSRTSTWLQPDYVRDFTLRALRHYLHTRFVALLRFDPRPEWADLVGGACEWIGVLSNSPGHTSFEFEAPPGIVGAGNTFPHALYARSYADVTPQMRALCSYPDGTARHWRKRSALSGPNAIDWLRGWGLDHTLFDLET